MQYVLHTKRSLIACAMLMRHYSLLACYSSHRRGTCMRSVGGMPRIRGTPLRELEPHPSNYQTYFEKSWTIIIQTHFQIPV